MTRIEMIQKAVGVKIINDPITVAASVCKMSADCSKCPGRDKQYGVCVKYLADYLKEEVTENESNA